MNINDRDSGADRPDDEDTIIRPRTRPLPGRDTADEDTMLIEPGAFGARQAEDTVLRSAIPRPTSAPTPHPDASEQHRFRMPDGLEHTLDVPVLIGRKPAPPRIPTGAVLLLPVRSPRGEVSSTHIELRASGRTVVVTDLKSTNGTTVTVPGGAPRKLRQGESMVVTPGTSIDIGDGNIVEILPTKSRDDRP